MIKLLIVEDNKPKLANINQVINEAFGTKKGSVTRVNDIITAKQKLYKEHYDVMILDLVL